MVAYQVDAIDYYNITYLKQWYEPKAAADPLWRSANMVIRTKKQWTMILQCLGFYTKNPSKKAGRRADISLDKEAAKQWLIDSTHYTEADFAGGGALPAIRAAPASPVPPTVAAVGGAASPLGPVIPLEEDGACGAAAPASLALSFMTAVEAGADVAAAFSGPLAAGYAELAGVQAGSVDPGEAPHSAVVTAVLTAAGAAARANATAAAHPPDAASPPAAMTPLHGAGALVASEAPRLGVARKRKAPDSPRSLFEEPTSSRQALES